MPLKRRSFLCGSVVAIKSGQSHASTDLPRVRYGGDTAFAPFESLDAQGRPQGFQIDLLAELGPAAGLTFGISLKPWRTIEADFKRGDLDVVAMVDTGPRREWALFTRGHATPALALYHRQDLPPPEGLHDLVGQRLAVADSDAMRDTLSNWLTGLPSPAVTAADATQALAAVQQGRADVALLPRAYADPVLAASLVQGVIAKGLNLGLQTYALAVAPGRETLRSKLQEGLDRLEATGRLQALRVRWLSSHRDVAERGALQRHLGQQELWTWGVAGVSTAALAMLGAGLWRRGQRVAQERQRRRGAEAALQRAEALLDLAFSRSPDPMLIIESGSQLVRDANPSLLGLLGVPAASVIGQPLSALDWGKQVGKLLQRTLSLVGDGANETAPLQLQRADGSQRDCLVSTDILMIGGQQHVFVILRDITDQLTQDAPLRSSYDAMAEQLATAQRAQQAATEGQALAEDRLHEFTRVVAHDLKTPLNAVQGFAGLLLQTLQSGRLREAQTYTQHIDRAAQRMNLMINALAGLARVSQQALHRRTVDMELLARDSAELLSASHPEWRCLLRIDALPSAQADRELAAQVWQNLLDNAMKYSARVAEPKVRVDSFQDQRGTWYRVTDNGAGFDMAQAQSLFMPFKRMHSDQQFNGTGVGLSLVRRIVDHHRGEIRLRSAPGTGTVAEFTLDADRGRSVGSHDRT
jgi:PAS domain S-box-containing protein